MRNITLILSIFFINSEFAFSTQPTQLFDQRRSPSHDSQSSINIGQHRGVTPDNNKSNSTFLNNDINDYGKLSNVPDNLAHCTNEFMASCTPINCKKYSTKYTLCKRCDLPSQQLEDCLDAAKEHVSQVGSSVMNASKGEGTKATEVYDRLVSAKNVLDKQKDFLNLLDRPIKGTFHMPIAIPLEVKKVKVSIHPVSELLSTIEEKYNLHEKPNQDTLIQNWDNMLFAQVGTILQTNTLLISTIVKNQIENMFNKKRTKIDKSKLEALYKKIQTQDLTLKQDIQQKNMEGTSYNFQEQLMDNLRIDYQKALNLYNG